MKKISITFLTLLMFSVNTKAEEQLKLKYIDGAICVQAVICNGSNSVKAHFLIDIGQVEAVIISSNLAQLLELDESAKLKLVFNDLAIENLKFKSAEIEGLDDFSRNNAQQLNEIPVYGILGAKIFDSNVIQLDIQNGTLKYGSLKIPAATELQLYEKSSRYLLQIEPDAGYVVPAMFTTADYECIFDSDCASLAGNEYADFDNCLLGSVNIRKYTAIRVCYEYRSKLTDAECMLGNSFWQNFVLYIKPVKRRLAFVPVDDEIVSDVNEQIYFNAIADKNKAAVVEYIEKYPDCRLKYEACCFLLDAAIEAEDKLQIEKSIERLAANQEPTIAAQTLFGYAKRAIENDNKFQIAELFLNNAKDEVLKTENAALLTAKINSYLGWTAIEQQHLNQARKYLFSALLLSPDEPFTNYLAGKLYLQQGQLVRAWVRFLRAAIADEPFADAIPALKQLQQTPEFNTLFDANDACDFLQGHIFDDNGQLSSYAKILKYRCGGIIRAAIEKLQEQRQ